MTIIPKLIQAGAHRGGGDIAEALQGVIHEVVLVDPNRKNAEKVADIHRARGRRTTIDEARIEDVIDAFDPEAPIAAAPDSLRAIRTVVERGARQGLVTAQGLIRGSAPSGQNLPIAAQITLPPGRTDLRSDARTFLAELERLAPPSSSSVMRTSRLAERRMETQRKRLASVTAFHLMNRDRLAEREYATDLFLDDDIHYPLVLARGRPELDELAEAAGDVARTRVAAIAFLDETGIDVVFVHLERTGVQLRAHLVLEAPRPVVEVRSTAFMPTSRAVLPTAFTD